MTDYAHLLIEHRGPVTLVTINRPDSLNAANHTLHRELGQIWIDLGNDPHTRAVVITGAGRAFSAGADLAMALDASSSFENAAASFEAGSRVVYNMINFDKPVVSAINGVAVGAGLAVALLADISVIGEDVRLTDGHTRIGLAAGDHAAIIWPLLCGMAKSKLYLLTADYIDGVEAERIGLVSRCVPTTEVLNTALDYAERLAHGPQFAIRWTKRALNNWLRSAGPIFDTSLALEHLTLLSADVQEGLLAMRQKRPAAFPSAQRSDDS